MSQKEITLPVKPQPSHSRNRSYAAYAIALTFILLALGRFVNLTADFPNGLTSYGATYTDEGWWSRNAVALVREGNWYIDDGYNTILNLPTVPLLQTLWFKAFGVSQAAARALTATCSVIVSALVYAIARRELKPSLAWIAPFIILSSYPVFAFSRIALLEMPMMVLVLLSLWLATVPNMRAIALSAGLITLAILAKTTALFALPMIAILTALQPGPMRQKSQRISIWIGCFAVAYGCYHLFWAPEASPSYLYFERYNVSSKIHRSWFSAFKGPLRVLKYCFQTFPILFPLLAVCAIALAKIKKYRTSYLVQIIVLWSVLFLGGLSVSNYAAPRYFIVLIVPIALSIPVALNYLFSRSDKGKIVFLSAVLLSVVISLFRISSYLYSPSYSFINMAQQVEAYVASNPDHPPTLMGHFADSIALATDVKAINDEMGFQSLPYRIERFNPGYYLSIGAVKEPIAAILQEYYQLKLIETFDVYENYDYGKAVFFYELTPNESRHMVEK